jgi:peptidyl-prolyl cis-trans isomerase SurA
MKTVRNAWKAGLGFFIAVSAIGLSAQSAAPPQATVPPASESKIVEKIIVKVNGEILTQSQLELEQIQQIRDRTPDGRQMSNADVQKAMLELTPGILLNAIDELLLAQRGRELGIKYTDDNFKTSLEAVKKQNSIKDDAQLAKELATAGITLQQLRENFEKAWLMRGVQQKEIARNSALTEQEARQYYKAHPEEFTKPPTVTVREILVSVPTETVNGQASFSAGLDDAAKEKINAIRARAIAGEDFVKLVGELSDSATKANGGIIGPAVIDDLNPAFKAAIEKLKPGEISEPVRLRAGYQLFKLESRTVGEAEPFETVRDQIAQKIYESRMDVETAKYLEKLRAQALIEWKDENYKKMYETASAARAKGGLVQ